MPEEEGCLGGRNSRFRGLVRFLRMLTIVIGVSVGLLGSCYLVLLAPWRGPICVTESRKTITDPAGYDFEITDTYCSAIAHTAVAHIYGLKRGEPGRTLLFKYDPVEITGLPEVRISEDKIVISVSWVGQIFGRKHTWRGMKIEYDIARVDHAARELNLDDDR